MSVRIKWTDGRDRSPKPHAPEIHEAEVTPRIIETREPTLWEMEQNFEQHVSEIVSNYKMDRTLLVPKEQFLNRLNNGCRKCPQNLWDENARLGLGKCKHSSCGCTKLKLWFKALKCPIGAWPNE